MILAVQMPLLLLGAADVVRIADHGDQENKGDVFSK